MTPVLVDTGFLVALFDPTDKLSAPATRYITQHRHPLATVSATIVETCFFLSPQSKINLLTWVRRGALSIVEVPVEAYAQLEMTLGRYADHDIDFVDAALVWLAGETGALRVLTTDRTDFTLFRLKGGRQLELIDWQSPKR